MLSVVGGVDSHISTDALDMDLWLWVTPVMLCWAGQHSACFMVNGERQQSVVGTWYFCTLPTPAFLFCLEKDSVPAGIRCCAKDRHITSQVLSLLAAGVIQKHTLTGLKRHSHVSAERSTALAWVGFPAPTRWLTIAYNSSSRGIYHHVLASFTCKWNTSIHIH